jgi:hypothetical protein
MPETQPNQSHTGYPFSLMGILLVALFLGHDAFMAAEAAAMPGVAMEHMRQPRSAPHAAHPGTDVTTAPASGHPENCRIGQPGLTPSGGATGGPTALAAAITDPLASAVALDLPGSLTWQEPHWPPGRQRALWQVYRI